MTPEQKESGVDELLAQFGTLARHDLDELRTERIRKRSRRILARHRRQSRRIRAAASRLYSGYLEPVLVCGLAGAILFWAFERARFILL
jgi:VIT1/CCC1 family predicted Fe2+/Mn2+ transporter